MAVLLLNAQGCCRMPTQPEVQAWHADTSRHVPVRIQMTAAMFSICRVINCELSSGCLLVLQAQPYGNTNTATCTSCRTGPAQHIVTGLQMS
jgi:hypothetical protein